MNRLTVIRFRAVIGECINIPTYLFTQLIKGDAHIRADTQNNERHGNPTVEDMIDPTLHLAERRLE